jgi:hypothetical protein
LPRHALRLLEPEERAQKHERQAHPKPQHDERKDSRKGGRAARLGAGNDEIQGQETDKGRAGEEEGRPDNTQRAGKGKKKCGAMQQKSPIFIDYWWSCEQKKKKKKKKKKILNF